MKPVGHLRYAWSALIEAKKHLSSVGEAFEHTPLPTPELNIRAGIAIGTIFRAVEALRPVLEHAESQTHNDNGETPLDWARESRAAHGRFLYCFRELGKCYPDKPIPDECIAELESWVGIFDTLVESLELGEAKEKKT